MVGENTGGREGLEGCQRIGEVSDLRGLPDVYRLRLCKEEA